MSDGEVGQARLRVGEGASRRRRSHAASLTVTLVAIVLGLFWIVRARAQEPYPDWHGQWVRIDHGHGPQFDPDKPAGRGQQIPLNAEYQAIFDRNLARLRSGEQSYNPQLGCLPPGMPRTMILYEPMEAIITPATTYLKFVFMNDLRRIYTDGRDWPDKVDPAFVGYSIGRWVDSTGSGHYDRLDVETRDIKGPRSLAMGIPLHEDNRTIVKEKIYLEPGNADIMHDDVTTVDDAFTRPYTVSMTYAREHHPVWTEFICAEGNNHVIIGKDTYFLSGDHQLMPTRKGQQPPDLRNFANHTANQ
ncbi:MAG TPA: hypothetical protein VKW08_11925 [Xanthobacteraceae bacterium]|nr:hypothetical protein [Xanthobacteraceae bacterium]